MKNSDFEMDLLDTADIMKRGYAFLINNVGKSVALITVLVACLVTFTDIGFHDFGTAGFTSTLAMMLIGSYLMYFSLEEAGERLGEETEQFRSATEKYTAAKSKINADMTGELRQFCSDYSREELAYRRNSFLVCHSLTPDEYESYKNGSCVEKRNARIFRKADRIKAIPLTVSMLLDREKSSSKSELYNPNKAKTVRMILKLIPTTVCMLFTGSVMLSAKDGLSAGVVIESILRLATLPIVGFKGYSAGYMHAKNSRSAWIETKARLLDAFISSREKA